MKILKNTVIKLMRVYAWRISKELILVRSELATYKNNTDLLEGNSEFLK